MNQFKINESDYKVHEENFRASMVPEQRAVAKEESWTEHEYKWV